MRLATFLLVSFSTPLLPAQPRVMHYTGTSGFDHGTRDAAYAMFTTIAGELNVLIDDDATGDPFSDPGALALYDAIVFSNTSGNAILDAAQRANFEQWTADGGRVMGIHAASDTYRHSTANGNNTGVWDYYAELIGGSVQENPNHVSGTPQYAMQHIGAHASTAHLPDPWVKNEEYYYWEGGYYGPDNTEVLRVEETVGPNGQVNSYDTPRPISWYRELPNGSRVFYTALGHSVENYTDDVLFRTHIRDALTWLLGITVGVEESMTIGTVHIVPNPANDQLNVTVTRDLVGANITLLDAMGRAVLSTRVDQVLMPLTVSALANGPYTLHVGARFRGRVLVLH